MASDLAEFLAGCGGDLSTGEISELVRRLEPHWASIAGGDSTAMAPHKLSRMEDVKWTPPILSFTIERHGTAANGSTRAELQRWEINLETLTAEAHQIGWRQIARTAPRIKLDPIVEELIELIASGTDDDGLKWYDDKSRVRILIGAFVPDEGVQQTTASRRRRFHEKLVPQLNALGWQSAGGTSRWEFRRLSDSRPLALS